MQFVVVVGGGGGGGGGGVCEREKERQAYFTCHDVL
jgi:hypothetical protein